MTQPLRSRASLRTRSISPDLGQWAGHEELVLRPEVGPPVDVHRLVQHVPERAVAVEHHHHVVDTVGEPVLGEAPAGGNENGAGDVVERDPVPRGQGMNAAHARNHLVLERHPRPLQHLVEHRDRAVVQRRVTPHEERAALIGPELRGDRVLPGLGPLRAPVADGPLVVRRRPVATRLAHRDRPRRRLREPTQQIRAGGDQIGRSPLRLEDDVCVVQSADRRHRHVSGVPRPDPDDEHAPHLR